ncbi:MAG: hypothetical protein ACXWKN_10035 [Phenylobacterium sp.]
MPKSIAGGLVQSAQLVALLERAGITKTSIIRVTGPSSLSAMLWLCRHGYEQVGYVRAAEGCPHEQAPDALIVAHTCNEIDLKQLLAVGRQVRPGGAFIFQLRLERDGSPLGVDWLLEAAGFSTEARLDGGRRALIIARRRSFALREAA